MAQLKEFEVENFRHLKMSTEERLTAKNSFVNAFLR
jgi:hypothetical protein